MVPVSREDKEKTFANNFELLLPPLKQVVMGVDRGELWRRIEVTDNEDGYPVCRYHLDGKSFLITGRKPDEEAEKWFQTVDDHKTGAIFLFSSGFGYSLFEVFRKKQPHTLVVLFEKDIYIFTAMLYYFDLRKIITTNKVAFLIGDGNCFDSTFSSLFGSVQFISCSYPTIACSLCAMRNFKADYIALIKKVFSELIMFVSFIGNDHGDNMLGFCNLIANAKEIVKSPTLDCLRDKFENVPAFIISNGPSLDKNIGQLKKIGDKGLIISVESAILPLLRNKVKPDILAVMERICSTYHYHFENVDFPSQLALLCLAVVDKRVMPSFKGEKLPVFRLAEAMYEWENRYLGDGSCINTGPNVSHLALALALYLGANPIVFVGQDFAYGPGGLTHSKDSIYSEEKGAKADSELRARADDYVEGNDGTMLETNRMWIEFKMQLERMIAANPGRIYLNATEGGAKIAGAEAVGLSNAISKYCLNPVPRRVNEILAEERAKKQPSAMRERFCEFTESVLKTADFFRNQVIKTAQYKNKCLGSLRLSLKNGGNDRTDFQKKYEEYNDYFIKLLMDDKVRYFADQEIFISFYCLNRLGIVDTREKAAQLFKIQYNLFNSLNCIFQSAAVHMENAASELLTQEEELGYKEKTNNNDKGEKQLTVSIIVQEDESYLPGLIAQIKNIADEILVVYGENCVNKKKIAEIAGQSGARFFAVDFSDGYGGIKNFCLEHAGGKWVLFLRSFERLDERRKGELTALLGNPNAEAYLMNAENYPENHEVFSPVQSLRLIRRRSAYRFKYQSFERAQGLPSGIYDAFITIKCLDINLLEKELERRERLLAAEAKECPNDAYLQYMLGVALINRRKMSESSVYFKKALLNLEPGALYAPHLYKCAGFALLSIGEYDRALAVAKEGAALYPFYTDLMVLCGEILRNIGKDGQALAQLKSCLELMQMPNLDVPRPEIPGSVVNDMINQLDSPHTKD